LEILVISKIPVLKGLWSAPYKLVRCRLQTSIEGNLLGMGPPWYGLLRIQGTNEGLQKLAVGELLEPVLPLFRSTTGGTPFLVAPHRP
jgi:hypothetical protein